MIEENSTLVWFQRDLRIQHNPALNWALQQGKPVAAVFIESPQEDAPWATGAASRWWLHHSLKRLSADLLSMNIELHCFRANSVDKIVELVERYHIETVCWNRRYEPNRRKCERTIVESLQPLGVNCKRFNDLLLDNANSLLTASGNTPYRVFTPFYQRLRRELNWAELTALSKTTQQNSTDRTATDQSQQIDQLALLDAHPWHEKLHQHWQVGEDAAWQKLDRFKELALEDYVTRRDFPAAPGTSSLSPHLHFGEISPRQILSQLQPLIDFDEDGLAGAAEAFLRQLIWREFARYLLWHFPHSALEPMNSRYQNSFWQPNESMLKCWQRGDTGIAIVDAGMEQLWQSGWMHNRVRMLVASLLTKNLGISWQAGARWFWDTLVDADLANNSMGWQWVAGCGVDASPYYRIFNPNTQAQRFDREHQYIGKWLSKQKASRLDPIVDLADSRKGALARYQNEIQTQE